MNPEKILLVDDDELVLSSYQRVLRHQFQFDIASGGQQAIDRMLANGPYGVIISDMRMPGMNGIELLRRAREISPQTIRLMLTGNSDIQTAIDAVNEGSLFRFLTKPCPMETLSAAINDGLQQYRLVRAEKQLLEETLQGSIRVLTEVLSLVNPVAFNQSFRIAKYVKAVVRHLELAEPWQYEVAALLSDLDCVVVPRESGRHPQTQITQRLLCHIPRLDKVAEIIGQSTGMIHPVTPVELGSEVLRTCRDFDHALAGDVSAQAAIKALRESSGKGYSTKILDALQAVAGDLFEFQAISTDTDNLNDRMVLDQDLMTLTGTMLVAKGTPITQTLLFRLRNYRDRRMLPAEVRVLVAAGGC